MNFRTLLWAVLALFLAYAAYRVSILLMKKYYSPNVTGVSDNFQGKQIASTPAPSLVKETAPSMEPTGPHTPAGPNPPNAAAAPNRPAEILPQESANDPMDQVNSTVPIKDNLRHPERMFNAGGDHSGTRRAVEAGIAGDTTGAPAPVGKFSPDFAQNGGEFMTGIFANDLTTGGGGNYSEI
jgi:hypothetical protein